MIEEIATISTSDAIAPNSGITAPSTISTSAIDLFIVSKPCCAVIE